jgi:dTDP-4-dehydrorhamnose reductase
VARNAPLARRYVIEVWASPEPSIARIDATTFRDQLAETGHAQRDDDCERIADLGVAATRFPLLWEHADFAWAQRRLERLRARGVEPIITLLHHGSGPPTTDLLDPDFPERFAAYAEAAARAFPWVRRWTPINEPLTTARFATLYGVWYPNLRDERAFGRAMFHQTRAQQRAMARIRAIIPDAEFVLTEDLQRYTAADEGMSAYVRFLRERVYLSVELVAGRVDATHGLAAYLTERCGITASERAEMSAAATPPNLVTFNHYPHSERYLFSAADGGVGDVPAVYIAGEPSPRVGPLLRAAAERLQLPLALGEVHIHGSASERVRWLAQHVADVNEARAAGTDIRAVGVWAAFGMVDWHSLLRARDGVCEDGIYTFAGRDGVPQPTALTDAVRALARDGHLDGDTEPGWWERDERLRSREELLRMRDAGMAEGAHVLAGATA